MMRIALVSVLLLALAACQTTSVSNTQIPPITQRVYAGLVEWSELRDPVYFYITPDGASYAYDYCDEVRCDRWEPLAERSCERQSGQNCIRLATNGVIPDDLRVIGRDTGRSRRDLPGATPPPDGPGSTGSVQGDVVK